MAHLCHRGSHGRGSSSDPYPVELYIASDRDGRSVQVEVDGTVVRTVSVPNTGGIGTFTPVLTQFRLTAGGLSEQGRHTIRLLFHGDRQSLDKVIVWGRSCSMFADGCGMAELFRQSDKRPGAADSSVHR